MNSNSCGFLKRKGLQYLAANRSQHCQSPSEPGVEPRTADGEAKAPHETGRSLKEVRAAKASPGAAKAPGPDEQDKDGDKEQKKKKGKKVLKKSRSDKKLGRLPEIVH